MRVRVTSTGLYLPPKVETAEDLAPRVGRSVEWILERTGVFERRVAEEPVESMAAKAAALAIGDGPPPDLIVNASTTPRQALPDTSVFVQQALGWEGIPCHTVHATCLSFLIALHQVAALLTVGAYQRVLIVSSEIGSIGRNWDEPESAVLLGDGAAAAIVERTPDDEGSALLAYKMGCWPSGAGLTEVPGGGVLHHPNDPSTRREHNLFHMDGPGIYRMARRRVAIVLRDVLTRASWTQSDVDLVVPHQASGTAVAAVARYGFPPERIVNVVGRFGNTIGASLPMALASANADGRLRRGDQVLLVGTGAGLSVAAAALRW
jgi:3-oxoacyl-[acyl-carrier-protein] synthase-3